jgi:3-phenylpropionate/trans-cinnamate dioxygenase ferredoxin subunit
VIRVCAVGELPLGEGVRLEPGPASSVAIAVFHAEDGQYYAIDDTCTHQDASLADGFLEGCEVECPLHASCFDLRTGEPSGPPAKQAVGTHQVLVQGGTIFVVPRPEVLSGVSA